MQFTYAQTDDLETKTEKTKPVTFGVKGGMNHSYIYSKYGSGFNGYEWYAGAFLDTRLSNKWSIQNELLVSISDFKTYLEIPVVLKYKINNKFSVFAGPKLDIRTEKDYAFGRRSNLGLSTDLGLEYHFNKHFFIESRIGQSFRRTVQLNSGGTSGYRRTFRVGVGYKF